MGTDDRVRLADEHIEEALAERAEIEQAREEAEIDEMRRADPEPS